MLVPPLLVPPWLVPPSRLLVPPLLVPPSRLLVPPLLVPPSRLLVPPLLVPPWLVPPLLVHRCWFRRCWFHRRWFRRCWSTVAGSAVVGSTVAGSAVAGSTVAGSAVTVVGTAAAFFQAMVPLLVRLHALVPMAGATSTASRLLFSGLPSEVSSSPAVVVKQISGLFSCRPPYCQADASSLVFSSTGGIQARMFIKQYSLQYFLILTEYIKNLN